MSNYALMPAGRYWGKLIKQELTTAKTGNATLIFRFAILGKIDIADPGGQLLDCPACERSVFRTITENTIDYVMQDLEHLAEKAGVLLDLKSWNMLDHRTPGFLSFIDLECELQCSYEPYNGVNQERWGIYRSFESAPAPDDTIKNLDRLFGKHLRKPAKAPDSAPPAAEAEFTPTDPPPAAKTSAAGQRRQAANRAATNLQAPAAQPAEDIPF